MMPARGGGCLISMSQYLQREREQQRVVSGWREGARGRGEVPCVAGPLHEEDGGLVRSPVESCPAGLGFGVKRRLALL